MRTSFAMVVSRLLNKDWPYCIHMGIMPNGSKELSWKRSGSGVVNNEVTAIFCLLLPKVINKP